MINTIVTLILITYKNKNNNTTIDERITIYFCSEYILVLFYQKLNS
jgi:hypothetical protein